MNSNPIKKAAMEKKIVLVTGVSSGIGRASAFVSDYDRERELALGAIARASDEAPDAALVVDTVVQAVIGKWEMRRTPAGQVSLLAKLRRLMPAGSVDTSLRKPFGLA